MNPETIRDYLVRAEMKEAQAEALSRIFSEMATKSDVVQLEERMRADLRTELAELRTEIANLRSEMTWKMVAIVGFFATASTLLNLFVG